MTNKETAQDFADSIKDHPEKIIEWAEGEIECYQELIKIIKKK